MPGDGAGRGLRPHLSNDLAIVRTFDETNILRFDLVVHGQAESPGMLARRLLVELAQRKQYELQLQRNKDVVTRVREEAEDNADRSFERLSSSARQKVKNQ